MKLGKANSIKMEKAHLVAALLFRAGTKRICLHLEARKSVFDGDPKKKRRRRRETELYKRTNVNVGR